MDFLKQLSVIVLIVLVLLGIYLGALLPLGKAQTFIRSQSSLSTAQSVDDIKRLYDASFDFRSPVGQEEVVKFTAGTIGDILSQNSQISEEVARLLVSYVEPELFKDDLRHRMLLGNMYQFMWEKYGREEDFAKAESAYLEANALGPKVPTILYRLLDMHAKKGNAAEVEKYGNIILTYWPDDAQVKTLLGR